MNSESVIYKNYLFRSTFTSDINEHLPTLLKYALNCKTIAEYGVREVVSTYAFAMARPDKLICVDIIKHPNVDTFLQQCKDENINAEFYQADTLKFQLEQPVDLLFIDTLHTYAQLAAELELHHRNVNKFIILHDTVSYGTVNEFNTPGAKQGLLAATRDFLNAYSGWKEIETYRNNNGLTILGRV